MNQRASGVLLPIFSLPSPFSIGCFGSEAVDFARSLRRMGFTYWQILPLTPPAAGESPYQCYSAFAGNPLLIDLRQLAKEGYLNQAELDACLSDAAHNICDYPTAAETNQRMLRLAFSRCSETMLTTIDRFAQDEHPELVDYALFMAIRESFDYVSWDQWPDQTLRKHEPAALACFAAENRETIRFHLFGQYWFFRQWFDLRASINAIGIRIIGDLPIYVAYNSCDVWANRDQFELDDAYRPLEVAGVPPDYFTADGQLWGNPLYDWQAMAADGFAWWIRRIRESFGFFDLLRLDHFRGFINYWAVPSTEKTAQKGRWRKGPAEALFNVIEGDIPEAVLIAEDLGVSDESVGVFLEKSGLPGMRVLQFAFDINGNNEHLPHNHIRNCVAYSGTHDNNTLLGWLYESEEPERNFVLTYAGFDPSDDWGAGGPDSRSVRALLRTLWQSCAQMMIVPVQDLLGYGADARINTPGESTGQWRWRVTAANLELIDAEAFLTLNRIYRRENHVIPQIGT